MKPALSYNECVDAICATLEDGFVPLVIGAPGIGKTAMQKLLAERLNLKPVSLIAREYEPHEISGVLEVSGGKLNRHVIGQARTIASEPCVVLFDEMTACPAPVFANLARVLHERVFGDMPVHEKTVFWAAANPQSQSLDAHDMPLPLINRLRILHLQPTHEDVQEYFSSIGDEDSKLRAVGVEFASILDARPELLELIPDSAETLQQNNENWASPRSWERAVRTLARATPLPPKLLRAALVGDLGQAAAETFLAIREIYKRLPTIDEICVSPSTAKLPSNFTEGVGVLGLLGRVAQNDVCAAWIYCSRIDEKTCDGGRELRAALVCSLLRVCPLPAQNDSPLFEDAKKARVLLVAKRQAAKGAI